jgi:hypothetical protein
VVLSWKVIVLPTGYVAITVALYGIPADVELQPVTPPVSLRGMTNGGDGGVIMLIPPPIEIPGPISNAMILLQVALFSLKYLKNCYLQDLAILRMGSLEVPTVLPLS